MFQDLSFLTLLWVISLPPHFFPEPSMSYLRPGLQWRTWFLLGGSESQSHPSMLCPSTWWNRLRRWCLRGPRATHAVSPMKWLRWISLSEWFLFSPLTSKDSLAWFPLPGPYYREDSELSRPRLCFLMCSQQRVHITHGVIAASGLELNPCTLPLLFFFKN